MKKAILLSILISFFALLSYGQITLQHTYNATNFAQDVLFTVNGEKIMTYDTADVYLYNMDHTLWKTIHAPVYTGYKLQQVYAVSDNLFNSDNLVELVTVYYSPTTFPRYKSEVINESASVIQSLDSAYYGNVHYNSVANSYTLYAFLIHSLPLPTYYITNVYSLPGVMPCGKCGTIGTERTTNPGKTNISVSDPVPNPGSGMARINFQVPDDISQAYLSFYNQVGQLVREYFVSSGNTFIDINNTLFTPGYYTYNIRFENRVSETKVMIVK